MNPSNRGSENILIVRSDRLGDIVATLPMARAIKFARPGARVLFLARAYTLPILKRAKDVDEVLLKDEGMGLLELVRLIRGAKVSTAVLPSPRFLLALAVWLARVPVRIGTGYRWYSLLFNRRIFEHRKTAERNEAVYNLRMLLPLGIYADPALLPKLELQPTELATIERWRRENLGSNDARYLVLHAVSGGSTQTWPRERFVELGGAMRKMGYSIVLTGLETDRSELSLIAAQIEAHLFVGHRLEELAALLSNAAAVVSASTGPGHLAAALGAPSVGLFPLPRAISSARWGFRGKHVANISPDPIAGCPDCHSCTCMERIPVERVVQEVTRMCNA